MKKLAVLLAMVLFALSSQSFACSKLIEGEYTCIYKSGVLATETIDYRTDEGGRYIIIDGNIESKTYLDGVKREAYALKGIEVVGKCSKDGRTATFDMSVKGTSEIFGNIIMTASDSPGMNTKSDIEGHAEEAYCYRKPFRTIE